MLVTFPFLFSVVVLGILGSTMLFLEFNPFRYMVALYGKMIEKIADNNIKKSVKNIKKSKIIKNKKNVISIYSDIAKGLILDYNLPITIEGFNTFIAIVFIFLGVLVFALIQNITMAFLIASALVIAGFTYFIMQARIAEAKKIEAIMDAQDLLCPLAREGVLVAMKKVLENRDTLSSTIRPYFVQFVDNCESLGYSFKKAMEILNRQLGKKFDSFAEKAIVFEQNERKGMADIFLDIVDENAALREINTRKNRAFRKMNREFVLKTLMIVVFVLYSLLGSEYRGFMLETDVGKYINGFAVISVCLSFARCQMLQREIN
jgi:Flp pilus assembly protein TadB